MTQINEYVVAETYHHRKPLHYDCQKCAIRFQVGDVVIKVDHRPSCYYHKKCWVGLKK